MCSGIGEQYRKLEYTADRGADQNRHRRGTGERMRRAWRRRQRRFTRCAVRQHLTASKAMIAGPKASPVPQLRNILKHCRRPERRSRRLQSMALAIFHKAAMPKRWPSVIVGSASRAIFCPGVNSMIRIIMARPVKFSTRKRLGR